LEYKNAVKIAYTGRLSESDLFKYLRCAELFVWSSRSEGFGIPPLEAMAVGTVVVSSNAPFNELIVGIKFDYRDVREVYAPEVGTYFMIWDYDVRDLLDVIDYALSLSEDEKDAISRKAVEASKLYRPELVAMAITQV
jgi:glycosyltransferase involved in cell wall biosynthesis